jgi:SNF2 family DNA or RNA helicase
MRSHPFQCQPSPLHEYLADLPSSNAIPPELALTVWLPTVGGRPVPSPELQAMGIEQPAGPPELASWKVTGLLLTMNQAVDLLLDAALERHAGADIRAWRTAVLLGFELVASQQILPGLARRGPDFQALWMARPNPETAGKIASLAKAMPPLAQAVVDNPTNSPPARGLINEFLSTMVDTMARELVQPEAQPIAEGEQREVIGQRVTPYGPLPDTIGGSWLSALTDLHTEARLRGREADQLYKEWQEWASQGLAAGNEAFRITFRLEPPSSTDKPWALSYLLQATDDPSLLVPVGAIWRERGKVFTYLDRRFDQPQDRMLRGLGYAARFFPPITESLHSKSPEQALFTTQQAFSFLKDVAPMLEQSGFGVLVPGWWTGKGQLKARAKIGAPKKAKEGLGGMGLSDLLSYRWELSVGETPIDAAEFEQLVALKQPLIQVRGEWVALDPEQMQQALKLVKGGGKLSLAEVLRMSLSETSEALPSGVAFGGIEAAGPLGDLLRSLGETHKLADLPPPTSLRAHLRPYQVRGFSWLAFMRRWGLGACLADDMGLGKSIMAICYLLNDMQVVPKAGPALIVCPTSVVGNWRREIERFAPSLRVLTHQGPERQRGEAFSAAAQAHDVVLTSYPLLMRDQESLVALEWRAAILDEAQNIKNSDTRQARAARSLRAQSRVALTGTPVENRLTELWSIMAFLNPGYLGAESEFRQAYARPIERTGDAAATQRLRRLTTPFVLRRLKSDPTVISDLPDKIETKVYVPLTSEQATLYEATVRQAIDAIESVDESGSAMQRRGMVLAMLVKLKQICNHPAHYLKDGSALAGRSGKLDRLEEMLDEILAEGDRALIFTQFAEMGELLRARLGSQFTEETLFLHGGTPAKEREAMVRRFQASDGPRLFILSLKAGGVGLNLTEASHVFHFDRWWNPAVENQATDRAFRIGQLRNVQVHKFVCTGTLEERIDDLIDRKRALAENVLGAGESWLTELDTNQLRELVALRTEEVEESVE